MNRWDMYIRPLNDKARLEYCDCGMAISETGMYVLYTDHLAALAEKDKRIMELDSELTDAVALQQRYLRDREIAQERIKELEAATIEVTETVVMEGVGDEQTD